MSLKQGLTYLIEQARQRGYHPRYDQKSTIIPIFSFINQLIASIKAFLNTRQYDTWYAYFLDEHLHHRSLPNLIKSWQHYKQNSLECHLLQTMLTVRNRNKLRLYLKTRKYILQTAAERAMLDEVLLDLQDSISIIHKIFNNEEIRKALIQGIKNIFLAFKISQAKLYSSVLIEYLLAVYDSIIRVESEEATISAQFSTNRSVSRPYNENYQELFSSISNFQSSIHNENGLYKKSNFSHSHASQKKYQIIEKKFMPLKETSLYVSNAHSNQFSSASKPKNSQKSLFYEFISNNNGQEEVSQESNIIKNVLNSNSRFKEETSFEKQEKFYRNLYMQQRSRDKSNSPSPENPIMKMTTSHQRKAVSPQPVSRFTKKQPEISSATDQPAKNFSLGWFSDKLFETDHEPQGSQSFLRKSKTKLMKEAKQKRKQSPERRRQSTEKFEIENHLMNRSSHRMNGISHIMNESQAAESDKSEEFEKMVEKNQEFKEKMLKKSQIEMVSGSEKDFNSREKIERDQIWRNADHESELERMRGKQEDDDVDRFTSNFGMGNEGITIRQAKYFAEKDLSSESLRRMKKRNEKILGGLERECEVVEKEEKGREENELDQRQEVYSFKKKRVGDDKSRELAEKAQIIHKSIGEKKMSNFSKYSNSEMEDFTSDSNLRKEGEQSSYQMGKMKSLLRIIDDYRQNAVQNDHDQNQLEISESFYKKSRFHSEEEMDSIQERTI